MIALLPSAESAIPAFPGAEGWGADTPGGRGGKVYVVTNTNSSGAGSLFEAITKKEPRIIVFRVSGVIDLQPGASQWYFNDSLYSYLTVAGQTSPGGVTITSSKYWTPIFQYQGCNFHDGVWRFLRFRVTTAEHSFEQYYSYKWIMDHCSFSGGDDECVDIGRAHDFTFQWCTIANAPTSGQCYGLLLAYDPIYHWSVHHSTIAHFKNRLPEMAWFTVAPDSGMVDFRNNVVYNGQVYSSVITVNPFLIKMNWVNNYYKQGSVSPNDIWFYKQVALGGGQVYQEGNYFDPSPGNPDMTAGVRDLSDRVGADMNAPFATPQVTTQGAQEIYPLVLAKAGAMPHDPMDTRTMNDIQNRTGGLNQVNDARITSGPAAPDDADMDGMPDFWEDGMGLDKNSGADATADKDGDGYTNIEEYINDLALARLCEDYYNTVYPIPNNWTDYNPSCCKSLAVQGPVPAACALNAGMTVGPNPCAGGAVNIRLPYERGEVSVRDLAGRLVVRFDAARTIAWNGRDTRGQKAGAGVYLIQWSDRGAVLAKARVLFVR